MKLPANVNTGGRITSAVTSGSIKLSPIVIAHHFTTTRPTLFLQEFNSDAALEGPGDGFKLEVGAECHNSANNKSLEVAPANLNLVTLITCNSNARQLYAFQAQEENLHNQKGSSDGTPSYCNCEYQLVRVIM
jgi:hypothetical protein